MIGFTQSSYPAYYLPSDEDYKTLSFVISPQRWVKGLKYTNSCCFLSIGKMPFENPKPLFENPKPLFENPKPPFENPKPLFENRNMPFEQSHL